MEVRPPYRINPIDSSQNKFNQQEENGFPSKKLKEILLNLRQSILGLASWVNEMTFIKKDKINEEVLLNFLKKVEAFYENINDLEEYIDKPESQKDLHFALEMHAEVDDMLKGDIKRLTLCSYWKYENFSFQMTMEKAVITPFIDMKRVIIHLFNEISEQNWKLVISVFDKMAEKLLV